MGIYKNRSEPGKAESLCALLGRITEVIMTLRCVFYQASSASPMTTDVLLAECDAVCGDGYPWESSPLHAFPPDERRSFLQLLLTDGTVPACYKSSCQDNFLTCTAVKGVVEYVRHNIDKHPNYLLRAFPGWLTECPDCHLEPVVYDVLCSVTSMDDLLEELALRDGIQAHICVDHLLQRAIETGTPIPSTIGGDTLTNYLFKYSPRSSPHIFKRLEASGHPLSLPVYYRPQLNPRTLAWVVQQGGPLSLHFPEDVTGQLCAKGGDKRAVAHLAILTVIGNLPLDDFAVVTLFKTLVEPGSSQCARQVLEYVNSGLQKGTLHFDPHLYGFICGGGTVI